VDDKSQHYAGVILPVSDAKQGLDHLKFTGGVRGVSNRKVGEEEFPVNALLVRKNIKRVFALVFPKATVSLAPDGKMDMSEMYDLFIDHKIAGRDISA